MQRSVIPKVIGILATIFAPLGVGLAVLFTLGPLSDVHKWDHVGYWHGEERWLWGSFVLAIGLFAAHLIGGILAIRSMPAAPRVMTMYGVGAVALALIDIPIMIAFAPKATSPQYGNIRDSVIVMRSVFDVLSLIWPVTAAILMNTRAARRTCANFQ